MKNVVQAFTSGVGSKPRYVHGIWANKTFDQV